MAITSQHHRWQHLHWCTGMACAINTRHHTPHHHFTRQHLPTIMYCCQLLLVTGNTSTLSTVVWTRAQSLGNVC
jgi:hypothetical protein